MATETNGLNTEKLDRGPNVSECSPNELPLGELDAVSGGIGTIIPSAYKRGDGNGVAAFYAGFCMGLMGF